MHILVGICTYKRKRYHIVNLKQLSFDRKTCVGRWNKRQEMLREKIRRKLHVHMYRYHQSTGFSLTNFANKMKTITVTPTKPEIKMYHDSSSNTSVKAGT